MATYIELNSLFTNDDLRTKVGVACIIAAEAIRVEDVGTSNHANRLVWAKRAFASPNAVRDEMLKALLAANAESTVSTITDATDAAIQAKVDAAVDVFADGS